MIRKYFLVIQNILPLRIINKERKRMKNESEATENKIEEKEVYTCQEGMEHVIGNVYKEIKITLEIRSPNMRLLADKSCNENFKMIYHNISGRRFDNYNSHYKIIDVDGGYVDVGKYIFKNRYFALIYKTSEFIVADSMIKLKSGNAIEINRKDVVEKFKDYIDDTNDIPLVMIMRMRYGKKKCFHIKNFLYLADKVTLFWAQKPVNRNLGA
jgi:hypothetical protein